MFSLQWKTLVSLQVRLFVNSYGTSQILWPSLESQCTAGTRVELPHINCASDHRWTYPSCGQQSRFCGSTHTTNSPSIQLLHTIYIYRFLLRLRLSLLHFVTLRTQYWRGTWWSSWFRHCATSRRVAGSISDGVIWTFHWNILSGSIVVLGSTRPLTEMNTRVKEAGM